jgi:3-hydroxyisobutyrate dehydrogenase-like beta-hydroxyacid dehydrogenase
MGTTIGKSLLRMGNSVYFASQGRSRESIDRAVNSGFEDIGSFKNIAEVCSVVVCIGTSGIAMDVPTVLCGEFGFGGVYIDMNSLYDETYENKWRKHISSLTTNYCEAAIRGYPVESGYSAASTHLIMVSGPSADEAFSLFAGDFFHVQYSVSPAKYVNRLIACKNG